MTDAVKEATGPLLRVRDVTKRFDGPGEPVEVLRGVSLELARAQALAIVGPSGSGKSTLLHVVGGLERPTAGEVAIDGRSPYDLPERELARFRNRTIGFVFQDHHLLPQYTVLDNVLIPSLAFRDGRAPARERASALLARVGLAHRTGHRPAELSGGERQRAAVARALVMRPRLVLCDEPTGSLDGRTAGAVADLLFELHADEGTGLIVVTHSDELARRCARRVELADGRCCEA